MVLIVAVAAVVLHPLTRTDEDPSGSTPDGKLADLELRKQTKYREIRDAEMDFRVGKLSEADYRRLDDELRAEALQILRRMDEFERE